MLSSSKPLPEPMLTQFHEFTVLTLNIQSINAKFDNLLPVINNLLVNGAVFGAICLQETWLGDHSDLSQFDIPGYKIIHQGWRCTRHGGLLIYLNKAYSRVPGHLLFSYYFLFSPLFHTTSYFFLFFSSNLLLTPLFWGMQKKKKKSVLLKTCIYHIACASW